MCCAWVSRGRVNQAQLIPEVFGVAETKDGKFVTLSQGFLVEHAKHFYRPDILEDERFKPPRSEDAGEKTVFLSHLYINMLILPRQAQDSFSCSGITPFKSSVTWNDIISNRDHPAGGDSEDVQKLHVRR